MFVTSAERAVDETKEVKQVTKRTGDIAIETTEIVIIRHACWRAQKGPNASRIQT
jgi:hypothetical protein